MDVTRHSDFLAARNVDLKRPILIMGAGSIGSYAALSLAKIGFDNITVVDDGIVESENIAPQFYGAASINRKKVHALRDNIYALTGTAIKAVDTRVPETDIRSFLNTVMPHSTWTSCIHINAMDSMVMRKALKDFLYSRMSSLAYFIDARMAIQHLTIYHCNSGTTNMVHYQNTLFSDENAVQEACTNKAISFTSMIAGGLIAKCVVEWAFNQEQTKFKQIQFSIEHIDMVAF